jgi:hypothetical protein
MRKACLTGVALFALLLALPAAAEDVGLAVMQFDGGGQVSAEQLESLSDLVANECVARGGYRVITRSDIRAMLRMEQDKMLLGCTDEACMAEIGGALGVPYMIFGTLSRMGESWLLTMRALDVTRVAVIAAVSRQVQGDLDAALAAVPRMVLELLNSARTTTHPDDLPLAPELDLGYQRAGGLKLERAAPDRTLLYAGHGCFWSGLAVAAFGGVATYMMTAAQDDYRRGDWGAEDDITTWAGLMWAGYGLGAALMITGTVLWLLPTEDGAAGAPPGAGLGLVGGPLPGGLSLGLSGGF